MEDVWFRDQRVPSVDERAECVQHARLEAGGCIRGDADGPGNAVGSLEADAPYLAGQSIRLPGDDATAVITEFLVDAHGERGRDAVALESRHHLTNVALLLPCLGNASG